MKKKNLIFGLGLCLLAIKSHAQFVTGNSMFVNIGTIFSVDSLVLIPTEGLNLGGDYVMNVEHVAVPGSPTGSIERKYVFNSPINFSGSVGVIYNPSELNGNTESLLEVANSISDESAFVTFTGSTRNLGMHYVSKDVADLDIRMLTLVNGQSALPVTLTAFNATKAENGIRLVWNTTQETNSDFFEIQHSTNGKVWLALDEIRAAGESKVLNDYSFLHADPSGGDNLYRLKMVDRDKTFSYSQIRQIVWDGLTALTVFPNPASDKLEVSAKRKILIEKLKILDSEGTLVKEIDASGKPITLQGLATGHYVLKVIYKGGSSESRHFIKN
jgi:hypothetical protein